MSLLKVVCKPDAFMNAFMYAFVNVWKGGRLANRRHFADVWVSGILRPFPDVLPRKNRVQFREYFRIDQIFSRIFLKNAPQLAIYAILLGLKPS